MLVWWFIAEVDEELVGMQSSFDRHFKTEWMSVEKAIGILTFESDREVVEAAYELVSTEARRGAKAGARAAP